jgi:hypothetical protein
MAELVDAPASGAGDRKVVEVRVLFRAPLPRNGRHYGCFLLGTIDHGVFEGALATADPNGVGRDHDFIDEAPGIALPHIGVGSA